MSIFNKLSKFICFFFVGDGVWNTRTPHKTFLGVFFTKMRTEKSGRVEHDLKVLLFENSKLKKDQLLLIYKPFTVWEFVKFVLFFEQSFAFRKSFSNSHTILFLPKTSSSQKNHRLILTGREFRPRFSVFFLINRLFNKVLHQRLLLHRWTIWRHSTRLHSEITWYDKWGLEVNMQNTE